MKIIQFFCCERKRNLSDCFCRRERRTKQIKIMKQPAAKFRNSIRRNIAQLNDMKTIMRVETARTVSFWLVLPARGDEDCTCVLIRKVQEPKRWLSSEAKRIQESILKDYADRIISA